MSGKVKIYKNPARNRPANLTPYVPQYQLMGVEPEEYNSPTSPGYRTTMAARQAPLPNTNPRAPRPVIRQPYAEAVPSPVGRGKGPLPNVGNNIEQTWSSVDGDVIDDISEPETEESEHHEMIDNNDVVTNAALGLSEDENLEVEDQSEEEEKTFLTKDELQDALKEEYLSVVLKNMAEGEFILMVGGKPICSGPLEDIQEQTRALVFGEHPLCEGSAVPVEEITVLKKAKMKIGLFLE